MKSPVVKVDSPVVSKSRIVLTREQLGVPGIKMFGRHANNRAIPALAPHYHPDCFEITYLVHGNVHFSLNGRSYPLTGGDTFITFPNEIHDTGEIPISLHEMYWFKLDVTDTRDFLFLSPDAAQFLLDSLWQLPDRLIRTDAAQTGELLRTAFLHFQAGTPSGRLLGAQLLSCFLLSLSAKPSASPVSPDIRRALDYIHSHITQELPMEELAQVAMLSESRFKQRFRRETGISPRDYINFHKVEAAKEMLKEGLSVTETAMALNFSTSSYFSSVFHRYAGCSPTRYEKMQQHN